MVLRPGALPGGPSAGGKAMRGQQGSMSVISYFPFWLLVLAFLHVPTDGSQAPLSHYVKL